MRYSGEYEHRHHLDKDEVHSNKIVFLIINKTLIIIIIISFNSNWVVTRWQWLFYMYTKYEIGYY